MARHTMCPDSIAHRHKPGGRVRGKLRGPEISKVFIYLAAEKGLIKRIWDSRRPIKTDLEKG
jgi:hypothetical protein